LGEPSRFLGIEILELNPLIHTNQYSETQVIGQEIVNFTMDPKWMNRDVGASFGHKFSHTASTVMPHIDGHGRRMDSVTS
jgi:hypothetical protein